MKNLYIKTTAFLIMMLIFNFVQAQDFFATTTHSFNEPSVNNSNSLNDNGIANASTFMVDGKVYINFSINNLKTESYFAIERSLDGTHFEPIGLVKCEPTGHSSQPSYAFTDNNPVGLNAYYRIANVSAQIAPRGVFPSVETSFDEMFYVSAK